MTRRKSQRSMPQGGHSPHHSITSSARTRSRLVGQPRLALPPCVIESTKRTAGACGNIFDLFEAVFVSLDSRGNWLPGVRAPNHKRAHVNLPWGAGLRAEF